MNRNHRTHHHIPHGLLYSVAPQHIAQLHLGEDIIGDEFDWEESCSQYESESLAGSVSGFLKDIDD